MDDIKRIASMALEEVGVLSILINNKTYTIELLPATQAFAVAMQLGKIFLPAIGAIVDGTGKQDTILPEDDNLFADAAILLVGQLENVSVLDLITLLTQKITCEGKPITIDDEFKGKLGGLVLLLEFVLKENCGDLLFGYLQGKGINSQTLKSLVTKRAGTSEKQED
jgi:hypothetical protein